MIPFREHILRDLAPYHCTNPGCRQDLYHFLQHPEYETQRHGVMWFCGAKGHPQYTERIDFLAHMRQAHDTTLRDIDLSMLSYRFQLASLKLGGDCEHCGMPRQRIKRCTPRYLEQIALFSLPRAGEMQEMNSHSSGRSAKNLATVNRLQDEPRAPQIQDSESNSDHAEPTHAQETTRRRQETRNVGKETKAEERMETEKEETENEGRGRRRRRGGGGGVR